MFHPINVFVFFRNGDLRTSKTSQVSEESPGSIASFGEKVNRQNSLPGSGIQNHDRKGSLGSAHSDLRLGRSRSNSGSAPREAGSERGPVGNRFPAGSGVISGHSTGEIVQDLENGLEQLPVGIVRDEEERRGSPEDTAPVCIIYHCRI